MPFTLSPSPGFQFFDDAGVPLAAGKVFTYASGTTTLQAAYSDNIGTSHSNPITLDSAGRAIIYLGALSYKFVIKDSNDVQVGDPVDPVSDAGLTAVSGDLVGTTDTQTLTNKTLNLCTYNFGTLTSVTIASPAISNPVVTTGTFTGPSISDPIFTTKVQFVKRAEWAKGANVASSGTLTLGDDGNVFALTGGAVISNITTTNWQAGSILILIFTDAMTVKHNQSPPAGAATILLNGGADYATTNPSTMMLVYDGASWQQVAPVSVNHA